MTNYVMAGLTKRRADITGEIEEVHKRLKVLIADLDSLDATIRPRAFRPPQDWAHRGEMSRVMLSILRQATEPMTTRDIALEMLVTRALDPADQRLLRTMLRRVGSALRSQWDNGVQRSTQGTGQFVLWEVAR